MQSQRKQTPRGLESDRAQFEFQEVPKELPAFSSDDSLLP